MRTVEVKDDHRDLYILRCDREERCEGWCQKRKAQLLPQAPSSAGCRGLSHRKGQRETTSCQVFMSLHRITDTNSFAM